MAKVRAPEHPTYVLLEINFRRGLAEYPAPISAMSVEHLLGILRRAWTENIR